MTSPLLAELEALEQKATPVPWFIEDGIIVAMRNNLTKLIAALRFEMETSDDLAQSERFNEITAPVYLKERRAELSRILEGQG